ncbi:MAG: 16S rRNA (cytidine(1402)-2'-O)-methyltransferase, partial [Pseudomonadota bacterium]
QYLRACDAIYCEDTRVSGKLKAAYDLSAPLRAYHDHNAAAVRPQILEAIASGAAVALISDAGTPLISDPGYRLVVDARAAGLLVTGAPGACAAIAALSIAGAETDRFLFCGFPPPKAGARRQLFEDVADVAATLVFYETGPRLAASLADMTEVFGERRAVVARELTKLHEELTASSLKDLAQRYASSAAPKGEIVVLVQKPDRRVGIGDIEPELREALAAQSVKDAAAEIARRAGLPRKEVYARALALKDELKQ